MNRAQVLAMAVIGSWAVVIGLSKLVSELVLLVVL